MRIVSASGLSDAEIADAVRMLLGAKLACYFAGLTNTRDLSRWISGEYVPDPDGRHYLRLAYRVAASLAASRCPTGVIQAWFRGMNTQLGDVSLAREIRSLPADSDLTRQLEAATRSMMVGGPE